MQMLTFTKLTRSRSALMRHGVCDNFPTSKQRRRNNAKPQPWENLYPTPTTCVFPAYSKYMNVCDVFESREFHQTDLIQDLPFPSPYFFFVSPLDLNRFPFYPHSSLLFSILRMLMYKTQYVFNHSQFHLMCLLFPSKIVGIEYSAHRIAHFNFRTLNVNLTEIFRLYRHISEYWVSE